MTRFTEGYAASVEPLSRALRTFGEPDGGGADRRWLWLACRLAQDLWDDELWHVLATRGVRLARETGALNLLPNALNYLAVLNVHSGAFGTAAEQVAEVDSITQATGIPPLRYAASTLLVARGDQEQALALLDWGWRNVTERGEGSALGLASWLHALLYNSQGHYGEALAAARRACEYEDVIAYGWALVELIEAAVRSDPQPAETAAALGRLSERTRASGTEWALGIEARCRALLSDDESLYRESVERLARSRAALELARSRACTASGCVARTAAWTRATSCARRTRCSARWARQRSPSALGANYRPPARRCANVPSRRSTSSPRRRRKSPGSRPRDTPTRRSAPSCSSARAPSSTTCTRSSRSSASAHAKNSAGCSRPQNTPPCPPSPSATLADR